MTDDENLQFALDRLERMGMVKSEIPREGVVGYRLTAKGEAYKNAHPHDYHDAFMRLITPKRENQNEL